MKVISSHEAAAALGKAKCRLLGLRVKPRFLIWFPTEKLTRDKWSCLRRPGAAWEPSNENTQSLCELLYSLDDTSLLILFCLWIYYFLRQTVRHQNRSRICNHLIRQKPADTAAKSTSVVDSNKVKLALQKWRKKQQSLHNVCANMFLRGKNCLSNLGKKAKQRFDGKKSVQSRHYH